MTGGGTTTTEIGNPLDRLSEVQIDALADEFDAIGDRVRADLGDSDRRYIEGVIRVHRCLEIGSRALLLFAGGRLFRGTGTAALSAAKILENMEIGHNVLHGQWDWMNDPRIHSATWDWDMASTVEAWKRSHNYAHHTFSNIRGKDKDLGYAIMRIDPEQKWYPIYLLQPFYNLILMAIFEWGIAVHDFDRDAIIKGTQPKAELKRELNGLLGKAKSQVVKDYIAWPLLGGLATAAVELTLESVADHREPGRRRRRGGLAGNLRRSLDKGASAARKTAKANAAANVARNVWAYAIIFCGHFPDQTYTFSEQEAKDEVKGGWYVRQLLGAANIEGGPFFHIASGNLGFQVEHHLFPDLPSNRYAQIAEDVKGVCERYELPYNSGPFMRQLGMVQRTILRLALPGGKRRPKPGPYRGVRPAAM
jgi:NADPH-dependent stearoyl-CoA 9-desaturase